MTRNITNTKFTWPKTIQLVINAIYCMINRQWKKQKLHVRTVRYKAERHANQPGSRCLWNMANLRKQDFSWFFEALQVTPRVLTSLSQCRHSRWLLLARRIDYSVLCILAFWIFGRFAYCLVKKQTKKKIIKQNKKTTKKNLSSKGAGWDQALLWTHLSYTPTKKDSVKGQCSLKEIRVYGRIG